MIKLQIVGNLGKDCIMKEVNGRNVINFSVAHTERFKDAQGVLKEKTTWVECAYWTDKTGVAPYLTKGQTVYVEGTPDVEGYTNKEGQPAATLRMRVQSLQLVGGRSDSQGANAGNVTNTGMTKGPVATSEAATSEAVSTPAAVDDLPF